MLNHCWASNNTGSAEQEVRIMAELKELQSQGQDWKVRKLEARLQKSSNPEVQKQETSETGLADEEVLR